MYLKTYLKAAKRVDFKSYHHKHTNFELYRVIDMLANFIVVISYGTYIFKITVFYILSVWNVTCFMLNVWNVICELYLCKAGKKEHSIMTK